MASGILTIPKTFGFEAATQLQANNLHPCIIPQFSRFFSCFD